MRCFLLIVPIFLLAVFNVSVAQEKNEDESVDHSELAQQAESILRQNCYRCHKAQGNSTGYAFDVTDVKSMIEDGMIEKGAPEFSTLFDAIQSKRMPPPNRKQLPRPSAEDISVIEKWITAGAPDFPKPEVREKIELKTILGQIRSDLQDRPREDRLNIRYFTLTNLYNDDSTDLAMLDTTRMALVKVINSLSWEPLMVQPIAIDQQQTIYSVNISDLGWQRQHWDALIQNYPYALQYGSLDDPELDEIDKDIQDLRGGDQNPVMLRADWLISVATKPPLYYTLMFDLELPVLVERHIDPANKANPKSMTDLDLEKYLGVDAKKNFLNGDAWRSAFTESGISGQNRMIERHAMKSGGFYWKSYDFLSSNRTAILSEFPLGPKFEGNPFDDVAFDHDGGEIIFQLPNGLQAYLLIDALGNRIDAGPIEVVGDSLKTSGNEQIVAGVSCIACHRVGMIEPPTDEVRKFSGTIGDARKHVMRLYPEDEEMRKFIQRDGETFMRALERSLGDFAKGQDLQRLPEPVGEVSRQYHLEPMKIETVAAELFIDVPRLRAALQTDPRLRRLGLRVLLREDGAIKRAAWESPAAFPLMKQAARQFGFDPR